MCGTLNHILLIEYVLHKLTYKIRIPVILHDNLNPPYCVFVLCIVYLVYCILYICILYIVLYKLCMYLFILHIVYCVAICFMNVCCIRYVSAILLVQELVHNSCVTAWTCKQNWSACKFDYYKTINLLSIQNFQYLFFF